MNNKKKIVTTVTTVTEEIVVNELTEIVCVLDRSGSMSNIIDDMIGGFNQFLEEQKKLDGECTITIALFDDRYELLYDNVDIQKIKPITRLEWSPRGSTALYDAVGKSINDVEARHEKTKKPDKVLVCVVTDGQENASREFSKDGIKTLIANKETGDWNFMYLAANQDAFSVGGGMGFGVGNTINFTASASGSAMVNNVLSDATAYYRSVSKFDSDYSLKSKNIISNTLKSDSNTFTNGTSQAPDLESK